MKYVITVSDREEGSKGGVAVDIDPPLPVMDVKKMTMAELVARITWQRSVEAVNSLAAKAEAAGVLVEDVSLHVDRTQH